MGHVRVSTGKQERSGLGLEAQQAALIKFAEAEGFALVETMVETESGKTDDRRDKGRELQAEAEARAEALRPVFAELASLSHRAAANALNERGIKTATGKAWTAMQVIRVRDRLRPEPPTAGRISGRLWAALARSMIAVLAGACEASSRCPFLPRRIGETIPGFDAPNSNPLLRCSPVHRDITRRGARASIASTPTRPIPSIRG